MTKMVRGGPAGKPSAECAHVANSLPVQAFQATTDSSDLFNVPTDRQNPIYNVCQLSDSSPETFNVILFVSILVKNWFIIKFRIL